MPPYVGQVSDIDSLAPLKSLQRVKSIRIEDLPGVTSLIGLENIATIDGQLELINNGGLTSLLGLRIKTAVSIVIASNSRMTSIGALKTLTTIGGSLSIRNNEMLTSLRGLDS